MAWHRGQAYEQDLRDRALSAEGTIYAVARPDADPAVRMG